MKSLKKATSADGELELLHKLNHTKPEDREEDREKFHEAIH